MESQITNNCMNIRKEISDFRALLFQSLTCKRNLPNDDAQFHKIQALMKLKIITIRRLFRDSQYLLSDNKDLEQKRETLDIQNLNLQSLIYEKHHLDKEIFLCKEYQTPNFTKVITPEALEEITNDGIENSLNTICGNLLNTTLSYNSEFIKDLEYKELENRKNKYNEYKEIQKQIKKLNDYLEKRKLIIKELHKPDYNRTGIKILNSLLVLLILTYYST